MNKKRAVIKVMPQGSATPPDKPIAPHISSVIDALGEDTTREGLLRTPERVERALRFLTSGYSADVNTIVIMGLWTNWVIEATARHASDMGYRVFLVEDACGSNTEENHHFAVTNVLPTICYIVTAGDVTSAMK